MRPVTQSRTGYGCGNCTEASLASILEVALEEVPDLWAGPHVPLDAPPHEHQPPERCEALYRWLRDVHGVVWCEARFSRTLALNESSFALVREVLSGMFPEVHEPAMEPWAEYHVLFGTNPGGVGHCTVGRWGCFLWDPNPGRAGLSGVDGFAFLAPVALAPPEWPLGACWRIDVPARAEVPLA